MHIEEKDGPEEVEHQLQTVDGESRLAGFAGGGNQIRCNSHQDKQNRPHHREKPVGRREGRLVGSVKSLHAVFGEKDGDTPYCQWNQKTNE